MSFSLDVKKELSKINNLGNKEEVKHELIGYLLSNNFGIEENKAKYSTENEYNINRYAKLLRNVDINDFSIDIQGKVYSIMFKKNNLEKINHKHIEENLSVELLKAIIRGIFMGSGSINNPENKYHLEMELKNEEIAKEMQDRLTSYDINMKNIKNMLYLKDGEQISQFLAFIGASKSMLQFEEIRVQRHMNNKINRLVNCETANLNKVINASVEQIEAIKKLKESGNFERLNNSLKEIAELRLEHPDMSLENLGKLLTKPLGKSGVNYRLKKIIELSK
ncbi:MAG: DNA-binding protein WhiA [Clostridia bacterium]|nr:DNA-binding protein WhiA [Clostridia bacterium]